MVSSNAHKVDQVVITNLASLSIIDNESVWKGIHIAAIGPHRYMATTLRSVAKLLNVVGRINCLSIQFQIIIMTYLGLLTSSFFNPIL